MAAIGSNENLTLVLGGTGKTGRRLAERLRRARHAVRIGSRGAAPSFEWHDRASWGPALEGVGAVYVTFQPDLAVPGALELVDAFCDQAIARGVRKLVLLSGRGEKEAQRCEEALRSKAVDWTILRASWFCQNFSESFLMDSVLAADVALPIGPVPEPFIDVEDIAEAAFAALTGPGHAGQLYEMTGPRMLTFAEAIGEIGGALGRDIRFTQIPAEDYAAELARQQVPADYADLVIYLFTTVLDGRNAYVTDGVQRALGRPPRDFSDYAKRMAATGIWGA